jgi:cytochrome c oxidase subunit II
MFLATSNIVQEVDWAFMVLGVISAILLGAITLLMVVFAMRYRRSTTTHTTQIHGHTMLEITWVVLPTILVTWIFWVGYKGFVVMRDVPENAMVVQATGQQWFWSFNYPEEKLSTSEMVVPVGVPVKVELTSLPNDVVHSFYLPDFRVKEDAIPNKWTFVWFMPEREGIYNLFCAEFCGKNHSQMITTIRVVSQQDYDAWVIHERMKRFLPLAYDAFVDAGHPTFGEDGLDIDSDKLFKTFCASCHGAEGDGSGLPDARDFRALAKWKKTPSVIDIYRTLTEGIPNTQMRTFPNLTPWERVALAHRVREFNTEAVPESTPEAYAVLNEEYGLEEVHDPGRSISIERAMDLIIEDGTIENPATKK